LPEWLATAFDALRPYVDGGWMDCLSLFSALIYAEWRRSKHTPPRKIICRETGVDIANGVSIFPLFILSLSSVSSFMLKNLQGSNKLILSVAGIVALLAILED
jgi:hypothetical protein